VSDDPDLSVVVVTYECAPFIEACLDAVLRTTHRHAVELVVTDNASSDGGPDLVRRGFPQATVIDMGGNTGFATAVNAGLAAATGRLVLFLNPDTEVQPGSLDTLVETLDARPDAGIVAPQLLNSDGSDQGTARSFPTPAAALLGRRSPLTRAFPRNRWSSRYLVGRDHVGDEPFGVDWVSGACIMVRRDEAIALGGLDEGFFMHFEDADFCHRVHDAGLDVLCVPQALVVHHEGGSRRGWPASQVAHFHYGAYRFWTKHHAPQAWHPLRPVAGAALAARAGAVIAGNRLRGRRRPSPEPNPTSTSPARERMKSVIDS
jgi:N-acetylglucosaminyl-diphospho-decaprenol L-rhamnosyltransferase